MANIIQSDPIYIQLSGYGPHLELKQRIPNSRGINFGDNNLASDSFATNQPNSSFSSPESGLLSTSYYDDFYNRIHITPAVANMGNLLSNKTKQIEIWNSYFDEKTLTSIQAGVNNEASVFLSGQSAPPLLFGSLQSRKFTLNVLTIGLPTINSAFLFNFTSPSNSPLLSVVGRRVLTFWPSANWVKPIVERLEWLTNVLSSKNKKEQRIKLRQKPRRTFEIYCSIHTNKQRQLFENMMFGWQSKVFGLPIWYDQEILGVDLSIGATNIPCTTETRDYEVGSFIGLFREELNEIFEIKEVHPTYIVTTTPLQQAWLIGAKVVPVKTARLESKQEVKRETDSVLTFVARFKLEKPDSRSVAIETVEYKGYPVFYDRNNFANDVTTSFERDMGGVDFSVGVFTAIDKSGTPAIINSFNWMAKSRQDVNELREFLFSRFGKLKPIWISTNTTDFVVVENVLLNSLVLFVENTGYAQQIAASPQRRDIKIELYNGAIYYRRITNAIENSPVKEQLNLDAQIPVNIAVDDIKMISFITLYRLEADSLELKWETNDMITVDTKFRSIRDDV